MMNAGKYDTVDRAIGNKVCTLKGIIQRTIQEEGDRYLSSKDCSLLLCEMLEHGVVELGPKYGHAKMGKTKSWNSEDNVVSALLSNFDESPSTSKESKFAKLVFSDLLKEDSAVRFTYEDIRNAGASLTFLRFHLKAPEDYFDKNGVFNCTADELYSAKFDLLFCKHRNFSPEELIASGFKETHVSSVFSDSKHVKLEDLKSFGPELFEMQFYVKQLRECKAFSDIEVLKWFEDYKSIGLASEAVGISSLRKRMSETLSAKLHIHNRSMTSFNLSSKNERLMRESLVIDLRSDRTQSVI